MFVFSPSSFRISIIIVMQSSSFISVQILFLRNDLVGAKSKFFNRSWTQFRSEFGSPREQYWIGLDRLHNVSQLSCTCRFDLIFLDGQLFYAQYSNFSVGNSSTKYRLSIGGYSGDFSDSMVKNNGQQFTTYDNDNDLVPYWNCASTRLNGGGWWYESCGSSPITASADYFAWSVPSTSPRMTTYSLNSVEVRLIC